MNRCLRLRRPRAWLLHLMLLTCAVGALPDAAAQTSVREFPAKALRGVLQVTAPPEVLIDGHPARLSPGSRIRDPNNMLVPSAQLVGQRLVVNFVLEPHGLLHDVWLLTPEEAARKGNLATPERNFVFSAEVNPAPRDDGKTPFHLLPKFPSR